LANICPQIILDMNSPVSLTYGNQEGTAYNGCFQCAWSLRTLRVKLIKIGAKVIRHSRYVTFQMAEVLVSKSLFREILERIHRLKPVQIGYD
jgi:hypothetical protein